ncbi:hypothetical protein L6J37_09265 [Photobacterium sp. WH77]|uniref:Anacyclamide/piricyclamide family prenylated cyclic peptide n=1 Tax=Photobacterium arenosum TaxID=2774143 RepID=A0ABR9BJU4_9GAMM|nr:MULTISPECIES: hypothetical protein [Photobacterium]MBD8511940.1 hypothetical protein [Photobacterium arenosum]MBV7261359.1 hypothetical protein [Photobacterium sp. WH24]MCG2837017.1 hypothetical protein [Photobacterium sp. WH77]MCG2844374.1 hypothetical protein [Photobacterium sp. WH80]MDO6581036.1 hypothetical protein [Photobacterium sp. 2_MG-2023]
MKLNVKKTVVAKLSKDADNMPVEIEREAAEQVAGGWPTLSVGLSCMKTKPVQASSESE